MPLPTRVRGALFVSSLLGVAVTAIRWLSFLLAAIPLVCLWFTPVSPATVVLAGLFLVFASVYCWSIGAHVGEEQL